MNVGSQVAYTSGHIVFARDGRLYAQPFAAEGAAATGEAFSIDEELAHYPAWIWATFRPRRQTRSPMGCGRSSPRGGWCGVTETAARSRRSDPAARTRDYASHQTIAVLPSSSRTRVPERPISGCSTWPVRPPRASPQHSQRALGTLLTGRQLGGLCLRSGRPL